MKLIHRTIQEVYLARAQNDACRSVFFSHKGDGGWEGMCGQEWEEKARCLAGALEARGFEQGDRAALFAYNSPEWYVFDFAIQLLGGIAVPVYMNAIASQAGQVLSDSGAKFVVVDTSERARIAQVGAPEVVRIDLTGQCGDDCQESLVELMAEGVLMETPAKVHSSDIVTLSYTSGTTGESKGVMLTHENVLFIMETMSSLLPPISEEILVSYLPLAHIAQRMADWTGIFYGAQMYFAPSIEEVLPTIEDVRPTSLVMVPRVLEKIRERIEARVEEGSRLGQWIYRHAVQWAQEFSRRKVREQPLGPRVSFCWKLGDRLLYSKVRGRLGGRVRQVLVGGAALSSTLGEYFSGMGIPIYEIYGLTETAAPITVGYEGAVDYRTVGKVIPGGEVRIAEDGEVIYRGPNLFRGYWNRPQETAEVLNQGWFRTGDLGKLDERGYLWVTGRKKELICTAGGKNIAPLPIEASIASHPVVDQVMVVGDERPYLVALVTLSEIGLNRSDEELGVAFAGHIDSVNRDLPRVEQIKRYKILKTSFTVEEGDLTPTMKLKRPQIQEKYQAAIEEIYRDPGSL